MQQGFGMSGGGPVVRSLLDEATKREHKARNLTHSLLLFGGIGAVLGLATWLIWGPGGVVGAFLAVGIMFVLAPQLPPETLMRLYRARELDERHGAQLTAIVGELAARAELARAPRLFVIPSMTLNAFATGTKDRAAIAITEGLLRRLTMREIVGVLAHEMSHIRNNDLWVMGLADVMTRFTQTLSYVAVLLAVINVPAYLLGNSQISWLAILLLYFSPAISSLLQLGLSRTREYDADLEGAMLTGDPLGLASALGRLDNSQGRFWEDLTMPVPGRRIPQPSLLRSHPPTELRIARLRELDGRTSVRPIVLVEEPMVSLVGFGPIAMRPRHRWPGVWF